MNPPDPTLPAPAVSAEVPSTVSLDRTRPADPAPLPPTDTADDIPGYEILGELGRGGMGVVYRARQVALNRAVALKMVLGAHRAARNELIRFLAEAEAVAAVRHPNVVQVYEYGEHDGRPFMALEFVPGGTLSRWLKRHGRPLSPAQAAAVVEQVARGVAAAHDAGIVHRDLKPGNVLLADAPDDPSAPLTAKVADFGLAKQLGQQELTATGAIMGTPAYMAPEQATGRTKFVGPPADVYALGVVLYEALTGTRPFDGDDSWALLQRVVNEPPESPRRRRPSVPRDLELICLKCLRKEPTDRYPTAAELADDLRRYQDGKPVAARPLGAISRAWRWCRRNRAVAVLLATVFVALAAGGVASTLFALDAVAEAGEKTRALDRLKAESEARAKADAARLLESRTALYGRDVRDAFDALAGGDVARLRKALDAAAPDLRGWEWRHLDALASGGTDVLMTAVRGGLLSLAEASPDGRWLVGIGRGANAFGVDGEPDWLVAWDLRAGGKPVPIPDRAGQADEMPRVRFFPDGRRALVLRNRRFRVWDLTAPTKPLAEGVLAGNPRSVLASAISDDGLRFGVATYHENGKDGEVIARVYDLNDGTVKAMAPLPGVTAGPPITFTPDLARVVYVRAAAKEDEREVCARPLDGKDAQVIGTLPGLVVRLDGAADGRLLFTVLSLDDKARTTCELWTDWRGKERRAMPRPLPGLPSAVTVSPAGIALGVEGSGPNFAPLAEVLVWTPDAGNAVRAVRLEQGARLLAATAEAAFLTVAEPGQNGRGQQVKRQRWVPSGGARWLAEAATAEAAPTALAVLDDRTAVWGEGDAEGRLRVAALTGGGSSVLLDPPAGVNGFVQIAVDRTGNRLVAELQPDPVPGRRADPAAVTDTTILVCDRTGAVVRRFAPNFAAVITCLAISPDGRSVAVGGPLPTAPGATPSRSEVRLFDADSGTVLRTIRADGFVAAVAFDPTGERLAGTVYRHQFSAAPTNRGSVALWHTGTGEAIWDTDLGEEPFGLAFSADGGRLAVLGSGRLSFLTSGPKRATVLDAGRGAIHRRIELAAGRDGLTFSPGQFIPAFSPDGARLAVGGDTATALWDTVTFQQVAVLPDGARKVQFTPDGRRLIGIGSKGAWVRSAGN